MEKKKILITLGMILTIVLMISGSTYAYLGWVTSADQRTNVVVTLEQDFSCAVDGGGDITSDEVAIAPSSCDNSTHAIMRKITVTPSILRENLEIGMDLWINIDSIDEALSNSENLMYTLNTVSNSCLKGIVSTGSFHDLQEGDTAPILEKTFTDSTPKTYYLWIWLDKKETNRQTMQKNFKLSLGGNCTDNPQVNKFYVVYSDDDHSLRFYKEEDNVITVGNTYEGRTVTAVYKMYETDAETNGTLSPWDEYADKITTVVVEDEISPYDTQWWFAGLKKVETMDLSNLDTSNVTSMRGMFRYTGSNATNFSITGLEHFDTSNVKEMSGVFNQTCDNSTSCHIGNINNWDVSNVVNMMSTFGRTGANANTISIGDLSAWDVSNVKSMRNMFSYYGENAGNVNLGDLSNWDVSNVTDMYALFAGTGSYAQEVYVGDLSNWDVSNVTNTNYMFYYFASGSENATIGDLSNWNVSNVTGMDYMFAAFCAECNDINIGNLGNWNVSNVTNMSNMFSAMGQNATANFYIGDLSNWNVSNVTDMSYMFSYTALNNKSWSMDLSNWNVSKVTVYEGFNNKSEKKITSPTWVN